MSIYRSTLFILIIVLIFLIRTLTIKNRNYATLEKLLNLPVPQFLPLRNGTNRVPALYGCCEGHVSKLFGHV